MWLSRAHDGHHRLKIPATILIVLVCLFAGGCGSDDPEPTPTTTAFIPATIPPGATTVGDLLDRINGALTGVSSMRTTFWTTSDGTIDSPPSSGQVTVELVILPSDRHVMQMVDGTITDQQMVVGGRVYMRGTLVPAAVAPLVDANTWIEIDPNVASSSPLAQHVAYLISPVTAGIGVVSPETRLVAAVPAGDVTIKGRTCAAYTFGNPEGITYELTLDQEDLPCRLVMSAAGGSNVTMYEVNPDGAAIAPPDIATPQGAS